MALIARRHSTHSSPKQEIIMTELASHRMADINGMSFWHGFLCGAGIISSIAISATPDPIVRWSIYSGTVGACGLAFF